MNAKRYAVLLLCAGVLLPVGRRLVADQAPCSVVSSGAETDSGTGSVLNVGQVMIGRANNGSVFMHAGGIPCFQVHLSCLRGDVNGDGVIDGLDIEGYTKVTTTGLGTPRELCAANIDISTFVGLLLGS
jgi:hypothetical protein